MNTWWVGHGQDPWVGMRVQLMDWTGLGESKKKGWVGWGLGNDYVEWFGLGELG